MYFFFSAGASGSECTTDSVSEDESTVYSLPLGPLGQQSKYYTINKKAVHPKTYQDVIGRK